MFHDSHQLTLEIYARTTPFRASEQFRLASQMQRSSSSIPANIANDVRKTLTFFICTMSRTLGAASG